MVDIPPDLIEVELVYALLQEQTLLALKVPPGTTVGEAITLSGIAVQHAEIDLETSIVGIFGRRVQYSAMLHEHDRIEIYRQLIADPKKARRSRARRTVSTKR